VYISGVFKLWSADPGGPQWVARGSTSKPRNFKMLLFTFSAIHESSRMLVPVIGDNLRWIPLYWVVFCSIQ